MILKLNRHEIASRQSGQAMTEFLISASFFLIPLFLGMSLIAKYIDMKQTNVQAARYQAWEYTVWYANDDVRNFITNPNGELMSGFDAVDQPIKSTLETRNESKQRFYRTPGDETTTFPILDVDQTAVWDQNSVNPLWTDHRGQALYSGVDGGLANLNSSFDTPGSIATDIMNLLMDGIGAAFGIIGFLLDAVQSPVGFNAINTDGYAVSSESMQVSSGPFFNRMAGNPLSLSGADGVTVAGANIGNNFSMTSTASVLTDAWSAGGADHVYRQAGGTVPTTALNAVLTAIPGFTTMWSIAAALAPELMPCPNPDDPLSLYYNHPFDNNPNGSFWLGYIDVDAVHPDRLIPDLSDPDTNNGTHSCNDAGICDFEPVVPRPAVEDRECKRF